MRYRSPLRSVVLGLLLFAPTGAPSAAQGGPPRVLAVVPFYAPERMWGLYSPFVDFLSRATGEPWRLALPTNHAQLIRDLCDGRVDVAFVGPVPLGRANARCGAVPILVALGADGAPDYHSVLLTTDPAVRAVAGLRGKRIGFFRGSTAAHVVPMELLEKAGLPPGSYEPVFLESQDRIMAALLAHKISAAGVKSALYDRFAGVAGLRPLATSGPLPNFAFAALPSRRDDLGRLASSLLRLRPRAADAARVRSWDDEVRRGFVRPGPGFLETVLALRETTERLLADGP